MRERQGRKNHRSNKRPVTVSRRLRRYWLSTGLRKRKFLSFNDLYFHGWSPWPDQLNFTISWVSYKITITAASISAFLVGIGQLLHKLMG